MCLSSDGPLSIGMEKVLNAMPMDNKVHAERVLELNSEHALFAKLCREQEAGNEDAVKAYADVLYTQAQMMEGILPEDPAAYTATLLDLLSRG